MGPVTELEHAPCYICRSPASRPWAEENGFRAVKCADCGLVYVDRRPRLNDIDEAARTGEHKSDRGTLNVTGRFRKGRVREFNKLLNVLVDTGRSARPLRWLDVGSGHGEMIVAARKVLPSGSEFVGLEPNEHKRRSAEAHGIQHALDLNDAGTEFDVISLMNVYSHLPDPVAFLSDLRDRLSARGVLILQTGNAADLADRSEYPDSLFLPDHLSFLGERHLEELARRLGLHLGFIHRQRADTAVDALRQCVRFALGREARLILPYRSPFRSITARFDRTTHLPTEADLGSPPLA